VSPVVRPRRTRLAQDTSVGGVGLRGLANLGANQPVPLVRSDRCHRLRNRLSKSRRARLSVILRTRHSTLKHRRSRSRRLRRHSSSHSSNSSYHLISFVDSFINSAESRQISGRGSSVIAELPTSSDGSSSSNSSGSSISCSHSNSRAAAVVVVDAAAAPQPPVETPQLPLREQQQTQQQPEFDQPVPELNEPRPQPQPQPEPQHQHTQTEPQPDQQLQLLLDLGLGLIVLAYRDGFDMGVAQEARDPRLRPDPDLVTDQLEALLGAYRHRVEKCLASR